MAVAAAANAANAAAAAAAANAAAAAAAANHGSGAAAASSDGNDWEVALTKFFVGYLGPRPTESAAA